MSTSTWVGSKAPGRYRAAWLGVGIAVTVVCVVTFSLHVLSWLGEQVSVEQHRYVVPSLRRIEVDSGSGDIRVVRGVDESVTVERRVRWSAVRPRLTERVDGDTLRVSSQCRAWPGLGCSTDFTLRVPPGVSISAGSSSGDVIVRDVDGDVRLSSSSGTVRVRDVGGEAILSSSSGDIEADDIGGRLSAQASSGDITATGLRSTEVDTKSGSGDTRLEFSRPPDTVRVVVSSGDVDIAVPGRDPYRVKVETSSGDENVDVRQDPSVSRSMTVRVSSGDVTVRYRAP